jgi:hypothetical protein
MLGELCGIYQPGGSGVDAQTWEECVTACAQRQKEVLALYAAAAAAPASAMDA